MCGTSPAVAAAGADDELIVAGEANVRDVSRVTEVPFVFRLRRNIRGNKEQTVTEPSGCIS